MKSKENKPVNEATDDTLRKQKEKITSASIKNAHATGDGAVQKTDELLPKEDDDNKINPELNPY